MSEMKIGDKFQLPVFYECNPLSEVAKFSAWQGNGEICKSLFLAFDDCDADLICEAINNHDRMVEEIAELRGGRLKNQVRFCVVNLVNIITKTKWQC